MQETAESKLAQKRAEVKELAAKLDSAQRQLTERNADVELRSHQTGLALSQAQQHISRYIRLLIAALQQALFSFRLFLLLTVYRDTALCRIGYTLHSVWPSVLTELKTIIAFLTVSESVHVSQYLIAVFACIRLFCSL